MKWHAAAVVLLLVLAARPAGAASPYTGQVTSGGVPIPGATVTATQGETTVRTITDREGVYRFAELGDGVWRVTVEMVGFETLSVDIIIPPPAAGAPPASELALLPLERIVGDIPAPRAEAPEPAAAAPPGNSTPPAFRRTDVRQVAEAGGALPPGPPPEDAPVDPTGIGAAAGLLINGSLNNGASTPFAQPRAFGTNRPGQRSLYTYAAGLQFGTSGWDARPYSLTGTEAARPSYTDAQFSGTFQGPVRLPGLRNRLTLFVGYQGASDHNARTQSSVLPTSLERAGDFSRSLTAAGLPVTIVDPRTGQPFPGHAIPPDRISPQAAALLGYYPAADAGATGRFNYQAPILTGARRDSVQTRLMQVVAVRHQLGATINYQRGTTNSTPLLGFPNARRDSGTDAQVSWSSRVSPFMTLRTTYQFSRQTDRTVPYFANRTNISGDAGITGGAQDPVNWGPPALVFASDLAGLSDVLPGYARTATHTWSGELIRFRGRHTLSSGGEVRRHVTDRLAQQDPRGTFTFTGAATGSDFADFLLGLPQTASIAAGNADKAFRHTSYAAYVTDDWRVGPALTLNAGVRWEYEAPVTERFDRLVNLDLAADFSAAAPVLASDPAGAVTGGRYPRSLLRPDRSGVQPRVGLAWRPIPGSSTVVRAGYGIYRNTNVYDAIALLLAQQPPLSTTFSIATSAERPLTLADGLVAPPGLAGEALNTVAVDPDFRVGLAQNWQASVQRDLPLSLTVSATYLGSRGSRLIQQVLPNTSPAGAADPCPACPRGFRYLTSGGRSRRDALQLQVRRRLRNGFSASVEYTLAKATDNAAGFGGATLDAGALAQNWRDLDAEYSRSSFDRRHQVVAQAEYTTGAGGVPLDGLTGRLLKDWTLTGRLTTGSGLPLTPVYFAPVRGTGIAGSVRASLTGAPVGAASGGSYLNPAAYAPPSPGEWGTAGRNSVSGPAQFSLDATVTRTFPTGDRAGLDVRIEVTNLLNQVTYAAVNTLVTSPQFGLPTRTQDMRRLRLSLRVRF